MFRFPDVPGGEIHPDHIEHLGDDYVATLKLDGWRCVVEAEDDKFSYFSRVGKPIVVPPSVREPFEHTVKVIFTMRGKLDVKLDCELTGRRRDGDAEGIFIIDVLRAEEGEDLYGMKFTHRLDVLLDYFAPRKGRLSAEHIAKDFVGGYVVPTSMMLFRDFWDFHKANTPLAEGVVFKRIDSHYIGSTRSAAKNPGWVKCKWRVGHSGDTYV